MAARRPPANHGMPPDDTLSWLGTNIPGFAPAANALTVTGSGRVGSAQQHRRPASRRPSAKVDQGLPDLEALDYMQCHPNGEQWNSGRCRTLRRRNVVHAYTEPRGTTPTANSAQGPDESML